MDTDIWIHAKISFLCFWSYFSLTVILWFNCHCSATQNPLSVECDPFQRRGMWSPQGPSLVIPPEGGDVWSSMDLSFCWYPYYKCRIGYSVIDSCPSLVNCVWTESWPVKDFVLWTDLKVCLWEMFLLCETFRITTGLAVRDVSLC